MLYRGGLKRDKKNPSEITDEFNTRNIPRRSKMKGAVCTFPVGKNAWEVKVQAVLAGN
jgi:hypothetical protein